MTQCQQSTVRVKKCFCFLQEGIGGFHFLRVHFNTMKPDLIYAPQPSGGKGRVYFLKFRQLIVLVVQR